MSLVTNLLDDASYAGDSPNACSLKFGDLQLAVEHATNEGCVLVHLERGSLQLQFLHHANRSIQIQHHTSCADAPRLQQYKNCMSHPFQHIHVKPNMLVGSMRLETCLSLLNLLCNSLLPLSQPLRRGPLIPHVRETLALCKCRLVKAHNCCGGRRCGIQI